VTLEFLWQFFSPFKQFCWSHNRFTLQK
jgi:hypothetical protein